MHLQYRRQYFRICYLIIRILVFSDGYMTNEIESNARTETQIAQEGG